MFKLKYVFFVALCLTAFTVFAQESTTAIEAEDLGVSDPIILPNSPFYFVKEWSRSIGDFFTINPVKKAERQLTHANQRLIEAKKLAEEAGNEEKAVKAMEKYGKTAEKAAERIEGLNEKYKDQERYQKLIDKFTEDGFKQHRVISNIQNSFEGASENVKDRLEEVKEMVASRFGESLNAVDGEKMEERLQKAAEKLEGKVNSIEVLESVQLRLREKLPDAANADEAITRVIEQQRDRINEMIRDVKTENVGLANPAAVYCEEKGGRLEKYTDAQGEDAYCVLPSGIKCRQWDFYKGECSANKCAGLGKYIYNDISKGPISCCAGLVSKLVTGALPSIVGRCVADCVGEGESLGGVIPGNTIQLQCCEGLVPHVREGIVGTRGTCERQLCAQVITPAKNAASGECKIFPNACLPEGWKADNACSGNSLVPESSATSVGSSNTTTTNLDNTVKTNNLSE